MLLNVAHRAFKFETVMLNNIICCQLYVCSQVLLFTVYTLSSGALSAAALLSLFTFMLRVCMQNIQINPIMSKVHYKDLVTQIVQTKVSSLPWRG